MELVIIKPGFRFQSFDNCGFLHRFQQTVADRAPLPRPDAIEQLIAGDDFAQLFINPFGTHQVAVFNPAMPEDAAIPGQDDALLLNS